jgi:uncharacterized repeat protein (TIGR03803 family)
MPPPALKLTALAIASSLATFSAASAASFTPLSNFTGGNGATPENGPLEHGGLLYGTTVVGGTGNGPGTIYQVDPATGTETVLYNFQGGKDGAEPEAGLTYANGSLYGTTIWGGTPKLCNDQGCGTVFRYDLKRGKEIVLHRFTDGADGAWPANGYLVYQNGMLYGTTETGGTAELGTVFAIDVETGTETILHSFTGGRDGASPQAPLTYANGMLYGLTFSGGNKDCGGSGCGTAFAIDPATGAETVLHRFYSYYDGAEPWGSLAYHNGKLYGATNRGGAVYGHGVIFRLDAATGAERILYDFAGDPDGALGDGVIYHHGHLYGSTVAGGVDNWYGTIFDFDLHTGKESVLYSFTNGTDGSYPYGSLTYSKGALYGTASAGGTGGVGTLYKVTP